MVFYGFWRKTSKKRTILLRKNRITNNLYMGKNTKNQGELTLKSIENGLKKTKKTSSLLFYKKM